MFGCRGTAYHPLLAFYHLSLYTLRYHIIEPWLSSPVNVLSAYGVKEKLHVAPLKLYISFHLNSSGLNWITRNSYGSINFCDNNKTVLSSANRKQHKSCLSNQISRRDTKALLELLYKVGCTLDTYIISHLINRSIFFIFYDLISFLKSDFQNKSNWRKA